MTKAGLSQRVQSLKGSDFTRKALRLFDYLSSDQFRQDLTNNVGVCLSGNPAVRYDVFGIMAKPFAIEGRSVFYCTVNQLVFYLEHDDERRKFLTRCRYLFINDFEKDHKTQPDNPYTPRERMEVEEFLRFRTEVGLLTNYSATRQWSGLRWWSPDFLQGQADYIRDISLA
jgi:hypothetical protein